MPDYHLYDEWLEGERQNWTKSEASFHSEFKMYTDYSIGFLTRGCFRKCPFCVNKKYNHVFKHSPLDEFYDPSRKKICLLDDNFFGCPHWREMLEQLRATKKPFVFKQGLDERLLNDEKCELLFGSKYDGDLIFAFDNIEDYDLIKSKLEIIDKYRKKKNVKFYVLTGFESTDITDIENTFKRIALLLEHGCMPYVMRYQNKNEKPYLSSPFKDMYVTLARWCNQPSFIKKISFREFCHKSQEMNKKKICSAMRALNMIEKDYPHIAETYFDITMNTNRAAHN